MNQHRNVVTNLWPGHNLSIPGWDSGKLTEAHKASCDVCWNELNGRVAQALILNFGCPTLPSFGRVGLLTFLSRLSAQIKTPSLRTPRRNGHPKTQARNSRLPYCGGIIQRCARINQKVIYGWPPAFIVKPEFHYTMWNCDAPF